MAGGPTTCAGSGRCTGWSAGRLKVMNGDAATLDEAKAHNEEALSDSFRSSNQSRKFSPSLTDSCAECGRVQGLYRDRSGVMSSRTVTQMSRSFECSRARWSLPKMLMVFPFVCPCAGRTTTLVARACSGGEPNLRCNQLRSPRRFAGPSPRRRCSDVSMSCAAASMAMQDATVTRLCQHD